MSDYRQAVIDALNKKRIETMEKGIDVNLIWECLDVVAQVPSAQPERKKGKWIAYYGDGEVPSCREVPINEKGRIAILKNCYCSECDELLIGSDEYEVSGRYCPNCGAYMMKGEKEEL